MRPTQFFKETPTAGRGQVGIAFDPAPPDHVVKAVCNVLDSQGYEVQGNGRVFKFYTPNRHVNDIKIAIAKQALHLAGYERFDDVWYDADEAAETWGAKSPENAC